MIGTNIDWTKITDNFPGSVKIYFLIECNRYPQPTSPFIFALCGSQSGLTANSLSLSKMVLLPQPRQRRTLSHRRCHIPSHSWRSTYQRRSLLLPADPLPPPSQAGTAPSLSSNYLSSYLQPTVSSQQAMPLSQSLWRRLRPLL